MHYDIRMVLYDFVSLLQRRDAAPRPHRSKMPRLAMMVKNDWMSR